MIKINYEYRGEGLERRLAEAGVVLLFVDGEYFANDKKADKARQIVEGYSLDLYKAEVVDNILQHGAKTRAAFINRSPQEMASWSVKYAMAKEVLEGRPENAQGLALEAQVRGVTLQNMVDRVMNNARDYLAFEAFTSGMEGKYKDMVLAATTAQEIGAIEWDFEWTTLLPQVLGG